MTRGPRSETGRRINEAGEIDELRAGVGHLDATREDLDHGAGAAHGEILVDQCVGENLTNCYRREVVFGRSENIDHFTLRDD
jgi:hypothetical protein